MLFNVPSFSIGFVGGFFAGFVTRELTAAARPLAKGALRAGMVAFERSREALAQVGETFDDLVAEARSELAVEAGSSSGARHAPKRKDGESAEIIRHASDQEKKAAAGAGKKGGQ